MTNSKYVLDPSTGREYYVGQKCFHVNSLSDRYEIMRIGKLLCGKLQVDIKNCDGKGPYIENYMVYFLQ